MIASKYGYIRLLLTITLAGFFLYHLRENNPISISANAIVNEISVQNDSTTLIRVPKNIPVRTYFQFLDSITIQYDSLTPYALTEHILVHANPWIIDTLKNTDYYHMKAKDSFVYDQKEMIALKAGSVLEVPDSIKAEKIHSSLKKTHIDINIPEFKLRIYEDTLLLHQFVIRVGRNEQKYLKMGDRITDLRTITGNGTIVGHIKKPDYYNPVDGHQYLTTKRDDNKVTKLPQIPFLETEVSGIRNGQLIHPTTNPISLGKASSNGCIGTREADAWVLYYHAPVGTKITIRYDTIIADEFGKEQILNDIYRYQKN
ncbi:L,D-transpeptidase [Spongiivirga citrea]|uniref:L,D-transpeptidase family protein n=1 Tax=Spongiivirga citrea TaxID=1481457 RepID=A0A6M0CFY1_9FLAO|nr:L,D-transpeptidase [Spongiivirga citrea]NER16796.1 L,D-transpeptidase family protein [Spongiivirga citrea]